MTDSLLNTAVGVFTIPVVTPTAALPAFSPVAGTYGSVQTVTLSCSTPSSAIYYTTDGSTPTFPISGTTQLYVSALSVNASQTISAIGTATGFTNSAVASATYNLVVAIPTFSPVPGTYATTQTVSLSCATAGSSIYFTTDGSTPTFPTTGSTTLYSTALTVSATETIKAIGVVAGFTNSAVGSAAYVIGAVAAFDFYISPTGNNANTGTSIASAWAISAINAHTSVYSGKRVGIMPGTYDVSGLMNAIESPALMLNGGPDSSHITYLATCDSSGNYSPRTATLDAMGSTGFFGGSNTNNSSMLGQDSAGSQPAPSHFGNWTVDGIVFQGFSFCAVQVGDTAGNVGVSAGVNASILNCVFQNSNTGHMTGSNPATAHYSPIEAYGYNGLLISNCFFSNNIGTSTNATHFGAIHFWAFSGQGYESTNAIVEKCTFLTSGPVYGVGDTGTVSGTTIRQCYFDKTPNNGGASGLPSNVAIAGLCPSGGTQSQPTSLHNNICRGGQLIDGDASGFFNQPVGVFNNTWDVAGGAGTAPNGPLGIRIITKAGFTNLFSVYNNLNYDDGAASISPNWYIAGNTTAFTVLDYNFYGTLNRYGTYPAGGGDSGVTLQTFASFKTATGGDAHSTTNVTNPFNTPNWTTGPAAGTRALAYQVASGSVAFGTGHVGGLSSGAACNVGAWSDPSVTQIGSYFNGVPD